MIGGTTCGKGGPTFSDLNGPGGSLLKGGDQIFHDRTARVLPYDLTECMCTFLKKRAKMKTETKDLGRK